MAFTARAKRFKAIASLAVGAALMVGCTSVVSPSGSTPSSAVVEGGTLNVNQNGDFQPGIILGLRAGNTAWIRSVFEPLTTLDADNKPQPVLATEWSFAADGMSMTIRLRDDVVFHSGRKMTADDVKFTFELTKDPAAASQVGFIANQFASVAVTNPTSLTVTFKNKMAPAVMFDYFEQTYIVDSQTVSGLGSGSQVIGTGPYKWGTYKPGVSLTLEKNAEWWGEGASLDRIVIDRVGDSTAQISALRSGRSAVSFGLSIIDAQGFAKDPAYSVLTSGGTQYPLGVDVTQKPFDDVRVRQAIQYAIDRERINQQVFGGAATVSDLFWKPGVAGVNRDKEKHYSYNPEKAKQLLQEAGAVGASIPITVVALPQIQSEYEIIANNLTAVGLVPSPVGVDETTFNSLQNQGKLGPAFLLLHGQVGFGETTMLNSLPSLRANNPSHFDSPRWQELRTALLTAEANQSEQALSQLTDYFLEQAWSVPIVQAPGQVVVAKTVQGVTTSKRGALLFSGAKLTK